MQPLLPPASLLSTSTTVHHVPRDDLTNQQPSP